jgi:hypothetical protein
MKAGSSNFVLFLLIGAVIGAGVGYAIGRAKERPGLGLVLGLFLGWIGWIIIAVIPRRSASMTRAQKPSRGWFPDPYRTHELRFFDGNEWRADVADRGEMSQDPIPHVPPPPPYAPPSDAPAPP